MSYVSKAMFFFHDHIAVAVAILGSLRVGSVHHFQGVVVGKNNTFKDVILQHLGFVLKGG